MDAIYFIKEGNTARRIDSETVVPMHDAGYTIFKMFLDGKNEMIQLLPDEEIPKDYLQESRYGMVMIMQTEEEARKNNEQSDFQKMQLQIIKQQQEISELSEMIKELKAEKEKKEGSAEK